jgi:hypothetical protein
VYTDIVDTTSTVTDEDAERKPDTAVSIKPPTAPIEKGLKQLKRPGDDDFGGYKLKGGISSSADVKKAKESAKLDLEEKTYPLASSDGAVEFAIVKLRLSDIAIITDFTLPDSGPITSNSATQVSQVADALVRWLKPSAKGDVNALNLPRAFKRVDVDATVQQDRLSPLAKHVLQCMYAIHIHCTH